VNTSFLSALEEERTRQTRDLRKGVLKCKRTAGKRTAESTGGPAFCAAQESQGSGSDDVGAAPKMAMFERGAESYGVAFFSSVAGLAAGTMAGLGFQKSGSLLIHSSGT